MKIEFPTYLVAKSNPYPESPVWIVHTRDPFLVARGELIGKVGIKLFCWPSDLRDLPEPAKIVPAMAEIFAEEKLPGLPSQWSFTFDEISQPPNFLIGHSHDPEFTALIHLHAPRFLIPIGGNETMMDLVMLSDDLPSGDLVKQAIRFYARFTIEKEKSNE